MYLYQKLKIFLGDNPISFRIIRSEFFLCLKSIENKAIGIYEVSKLVHKREKDETDCV